MSRFIDADERVAAFEKKKTKAYEKAMKHLYGMNRDHKLFNQYMEIVRKCEYVIAVLKCTPAADVLPVAYCQFKKNPSGVNRYCTKCGSYIEDREYENHTIKFCYFCGSRVIGGEGVTKNEQRS